MDLHAVGSVVFSVVAVVDSFAAQEHTKINLLMSKMAQRLWKHFGEALVFMFTLLVGVGSTRINGQFVQGGLGVFFLDQMNKMMDP